MIDKIDEVLGKKPVKRTNPSAEKAISFEEKKELANANNSFDFFSDNQSITTQSNDDFFSEKNIANNRDSFNGSKMDYFQKGVSSPETQKDIFALLDSPTSPEQLPPATQETHKKPDLSELLFASQSAQPCASAPHNTLFQTSVFPQSTPCRDPYRAGQPFIGAGSSTANAPVECGSFARTDSAEDLFFGSPKRSFAFETPNRDRFDAPVKQVSVHDAKTEKNDPFASLMQ